MKPLYKAFIWGGRKIIDRYHLDTNLDNVGIMYHVIAIPGKLDCLVQETGEPLSEFFKKHRGLFTCRAEFFPVRMATTCGESKMSYHLHPGNDYAIPHEGMQGKVSGSVVMEESEMLSEKLFGNQVRSLEEFKQKIADKDWDGLFQMIKLKQGDFLHTPAGVIHGGRGGGKMTMTFSTNSDITYRFYDFDRNDPNRRLHLEQVYACINIPEVPLESIHPLPRAVDGVTILDYYDCAGEYTAQCLKLDGLGRYERKEFYFLFCSDGHGKVGDTVIAEGSTVFVPAGYGALELRGTMRLYLISYRDAE